MLDTFAKIPGGAVPDFFSPNGALALKEVFEEGVTVWDIHAARQLTLLTGTGAEIVEFGDFSPDGRRLLTKGSYARVWSLPSKPQDIVEAARSVLVRCLTAAQRKQYFLDPEPPIWCSRSGKWPYERKEE
jgi:hypothetical protein